LPRSALEKIAREAPPSPEALADIVDLNPWRRELIVEPLWSLLTGEKGMRVAGYLEGSARTVFG
jgi:hypothetical protein